LIRLLPALVAALVAALVSVVVLPLVRAPLYDFPPPTPFAGPLLTSPYRGGGGPWCRVNLHAHSRAWGGVTAGAHTETEVNDAYRDAGTGAWAISNYHAPGGGRLRSYEHGYNVFKAHRLLIQPTRVDLFDALLPTLSFKQYQVERLSHQAAALVVTHPWWKGGYDASVLRQVTGATTSGCPGNWASRGPRCTRPATTPTRWCRRSRRATPTRWTRAKALRRCCSAWRWKATSSPWSSRTR
jgi:hypothetical protein